MPDDDHHGGKAETTPASHEIHRVIQEEGEEDLHRHSLATAWSGLAAGLSMGFSFLTMAFLQAALPDRPWTGLISGFGYSVGFLIVILGKQHLFTESTLTAVLPVLSGRRWDAVPNLLLHWLVVLSANLVGTMLFAWVISHESLSEPEVWAALGSIAERAMHDPFWPMLIKAVLAGWLIALTIWLMPGAGPARVLIIIILTYVVSISHFSHSIAGSVEAAYRVFTGNISAVEYVTGFFAPTLIGNTIGGVLLVAMLNHAPLATED